MAAPDIPQGVAVDFSAHLAEQLPEQASRISVAQVRRLVMGVLPLPPQDAEAALALVAYYQRHKEAAYRSARRHTLAALEQARPP